MLLTKTIRSSTFKLALIAIGTFGAIVLALFSYVYLSTVDYARDLSDQAILARQKAIVGAFNRAGYTGLVSKIKQLISDDGVGTSYYLLADPAFKFVEGNVTRWPPTLKRREGWIEVNDSKLAGGGTTRWRGYIEKLPNDDHLLVAKDASELDAYIRRINISFAVGLLLILGLAAAASVLVTRRTVGRLESINATSRAIMESGLDKRIPLRGTHDEWDQVAENLNGMLDRIESLMAEVKQATDNIAHDLRTPLMRIRGRLEKAYCQETRPEGDRVFIGKTIEDLDSVFRIFSSLTRISQIEAKAQKENFCQVSLNEIAKKGVELYDAMAEARGVHLKVIGDQNVLIRGDQDLLFDALANLLDNAIKHGRAAGNVTVEIVKNVNGTIMSVSDDGPGIPEQERTNVLKRFYRLEWSRHTPGNGLGLSLVAAVARLHGCGIELLSNSPGLMVRLKFP